MKNGRVLGIDAGGTKICLGIVSERGQILDLARYPHQYSRIEDWSRTLLETLDPFLAKNDGVEAIGIGCRGHVDFEKQRLLSTSLMTVPKGFDLGGMIRRRFRLPVYMDNDVKAAACGELLFGAGNVYKNFACYNVGTGIAVSLVLDGTIIRGKDNCAGEIGKNVLFPELSGDGFKGLEELASGQGIAGEARALMGSLLDARQVIDAWKRGNKTAGFIIRRAISALAASVMNIQHLLELDAFVFTGGVVLDQDFFEGLKVRIREFADWTGDKKIPDIVLSPCGPGNTGVLGAAGTAFYALQRKQDN